MKKYLAIGHHGPVDPAEGIARARDAIDWIPAQLASGFLDCLYSLHGGGRLMIANAESEEALRAALAAAPDVERTWQITELYDGVEVIRSYLASLE